ncbi:MAG: hypothetical protein D6689_10560 [Deltaproteobacteria bacterium]|nr:MAG: hypothetical protein D6689_10560 [Deltaproteobacteria bacterium]
MTRQTLQDLLARHAGAKVDGDALSVPDAVDVSLYVAMGIEPLVLDKVATVTLEPDAVVASTRRRERYLIAYEDLRAVRVSDEHTTRPGILE